MKTRLIAAAIILMAALSASAQQHPQDKGYNYVQNVSYVSDGEQDVYRKERCVLDIYYPETDKGFATLVWFHGGGLEGGNKELLEGFRRQGFAVVSVNYRLFPRCKCPEYIDDAAMAVAWTFDNIEKYGGNKEHIYEIPFALISYGASTCLKKTVRHVDKYPVQNFKLLPIRSIIVVTHSDNRDSGISR